MWGRKIILLAVVVAFGIIVGGAVIQAGASTNDTKQENRTADWSQTDDYPVPSWLQDDEGNNILRPPTIKAIEDPGGPGFKSRLSAPEEVPEKEWERRYGQSGTTEEFSSIDTTSDGGYVMAGIADNHPYVVKVDSKGDKEWNKTLGFQAKAENAVSTIVQLDKGNYALTTNRRNTSDRTDIRYDAEVIKLSEGGEVQWMINPRDEPASRALSSERISSDEIIVCGSVPGEDFKTTNAWLAKINSAGDVEWQNEIPSGSIESSLWANEVEVTDSGYALSGTEQDNEMGTKSIWIATTDSVGEVTNTYHADQITSSSTGLSQTADGGFIVSSVNWSGDSDTPEVIKVNEGLSEGWSRKYKASGIDEMTTDITQTDDGGYALIGFRDKGDSNVYSMILRTDETGELQWRQKYGDANLSAGAMAGEYLGGKSYALAGFYHDVEALESGAYLIKVGSGEDDGGVLNRYDEDESGTIGDLEVLSAIADWRNNNLGDLEVLKVIKYWRTQESFPT
jgi:hypothetical protein